MQLRRNMNRGFTLVELITIIVLLGIIGIFSFQFIGSSVQIFTDTTSRDQLVHQSRFALQRLQLELRNSLPRSTRVNLADNGRCIEFIPIITSGQYLQIPRPGLDRDNDFIAIAPSQVDNLEDNLQDAFVSIFATNEAFLYSEDRTRRKQIAKVDTDEPSIGLVTIDFHTSSPEFPTHSPAQRFYITSDAVSWCVNDTQQLVRMTGYNTQTIQPTMRALLDTATEQEIMAQGVVNALNDNQPPFRNLTPTLQRNNLIQINLRLRSERLGEPLIVFHEVHVPNVP